MKLLGFKVLRAFGYLNIDINFNDDMTFLVGPNGTGKTTALRLIHAVLAPAFEEMYSIPFDKASLDFFDGDRRRNVVVVRQKGSVRITVDGVDATLDLPDFGSDRLEMIKANGQRAISDMLGPILVDSPVYSYLTKLNSPVFLGLDRRMLSVDSEEGREEYATKRIVLGSRIERRLPRGSLGRSLYDVQELVQEAYRRYRRSQEAMTTKLRRAVLLSAFRYTEISDFERTLSFDSAALFDRRDEIAHALANLGMGGSDVERQLDDFFSRIDKLLKSNISSKGLDAELLTNKAQIERIEELIKLIDEHRAESDKAYQPIKRFIDTMNSFLADTRKEVDVDQVGALKIGRPDKVRVDVDALSSGERQLLIIFGHLFFNKFGGKSNIFIVDEPELSLHLRWQEMFVSKAISASPNAQFILATHSPEIVGAYKDKALNLGVK